MFNGRCPHQACVQSFNARLSTEAMYYADMWWCCGNTYDCVRYVDDDGKPTPIKEELRIELQKLVVNGSTGDGAEI